MYPASFEYFAPATLDQALSILAEQGDEAKVLAGGQSLLASGADAVVIATMGRGDEEAIRAALATPVGYVGLVASSRRASVTLGSLRSRGLDEEALAEALARVRSPAGLDLGPSAQEEIAVAILAELVAWRHTAPWPHAAAGPAPAEAIDPICGMTVAAEGARETARHEGVMYYFCCAGCRQRFESDPGRYRTEVNRQ